MTTRSLARCALVLSTTPPIPREYGNRNRVYQTIQFLKQAGFTVSLLLYPFDEDWVSTIPEYYRKLVDDYEYFSVIPNSKQLHRAAENFHHTIDEWWDENIGRQLEWLFKRKRYDIFFVNYTFFSKALEFAPKGVMRILDTHDLFTSRRETFEQHGVSAEFFYTNADQEKIAFDRCDTIIAIKASEAEIIRRMTTRHVITVPYWDSSPVFKPLPRPVDRLMFNQDRPLRLGFIGAQNSVNLVNLRRFLQMFDRFVRLYNLPTEIVVAGNVCRELHSGYSFLRKLGRVDDIESFYQAVDAIIAPLEFSTGIKIKVGEALVFQLPVLATANAFDGFRPFHRTQAEASVADLCHSIASLATNTISFTELVTASRRAAAAALKAQEKGYAELRSWIKARTQRLVLITDRPFWYRSTFLDELVAQTIEFIAHIAPTVVAVIFEDRIDATKIYAEVEYIHLKQDAECSELLAELGEACCVKGVMFFVDSGLRPGLIGRAAEAELEEWTAGIVSEGKDHFVQFRSNRTGRKPITVSPLRYPLIGCTTALDVDSVLLLVPTNATQWEILISDYVEGCCKRLGRRFSRIEVPLYAEYDKDFLRDTMKDASSRLIMFGRDTVSRLFVSQCAEYRGIDCLLIGETLLFPQCFLPSGNLPSLTISIQEFVSGKSGGNTSSGPNTGWDKVWSVLYQVSEGVTLRGIPETAGI